MRSNHLHITEKRVRESVAEEIRKLTKAKHNDYSCFSCTFSLLFLKDLFVELRE